MATVRYTTHVDAVIAAQQFCQQCLDSQARINRRLDRISEIMVQIAHSQGKSVEIVTALDAAIEALTEVEKMAYDVFFSGLEYALNDLRSAVEKAAKDGA